MHHGKPTLPFRRTFPLFALAKSFTAFTAVLSLVVLPARTGICVENTALSIGVVKASSSDRAIVLSLSAPLAGGTQHGYAYEIYRDSQPHFFPGASNLLAIVTNLDNAAYEDTNGVRPNMVYYYKVAGHDDGDHHTNAVPAGLGNPNNDLALSVPASLKAPHLNIVFIGDSISEARQLPDRAHQSPPAVCADRLHSLRGMRDVYMANQGHSGATTVDFLPETHSYFSGVENAARQLLAEHPGSLVFSIMLGANDSANSTTRGAPVAADNYRENLKTIIDQLLTDFPGCRIFVHEPTWYSPNTHNSANYEETGLARLTTYPEAIQALVHSYEATKPGRVLRGDQFAFCYFAANYLTLQFPEHGQNGTFYLHPNIEGSARLGVFWADAIASDLSSP